MIRNLFKELVLFYYMVKKTKIYEEILIVAKRIARTKEGALFVIAKNNQFKKNLYDTLYPQLFNKHYINELGIEAVLQKLATLDGAVLISDIGEIIAYGAKLKKSRVVPGFGTKHAAASGITSHIKGSTAILVSEEVNWIKVFKNGTLILEMDSNEKPKSVENKIVAFLSERDTALLTAAGVSTALLGSALVAPVLVISGAYLTIRTATGLIKGKLFRD